MIKFLPFFFCLLLFGCSSNVSTESTPTVSKLDSLMRGLLVEVPNLRGSMNTIYPPPVSLVGRMVGSVAEYVNGNVGLWESRTLVDVKANIESVIVYEGGGSNFDFPAKFCEAFSQIPTPFNYIVVVQVYELRAVNFENAYPKADITPLIFVTSERLLDFYFFSGETSYVVPLLVCSYQLIGGDVSSYPAIQNDLKSRILR